MLLTSFARGALQVCFHLLRSIVFIVLKTNDCRQSSNQTTTQVCIVCITRAHIHMHLKHTSMRTPSANPTANHQPTVELFSALFRHSLFRALSLTVTNKVPCVQPPPHPSSSSSSSSSPQLLRSPRPALTSRPQASCARLWASLAAASRRCLTLLRWVEEENRCMYVCFKRVSFRVRRRCVMC